MSLLETKLGFKVIPVFCFSIPSHHSISLIPDSHSLAIFYSNYSQNYTLRKELQIRQVDRMVNTFTLHYFLLMPLQNFFWYLLLCQHNLQRLNRKVTHIRSEGCEFQVQFPLSLNFPPGLRGRGTKITHAGFEVVLLLCHYTFAVLTCELPT